MKKIASFLVVIMLLLTGFLSIVDNNFNVEGSSGGNGEESIGLDYDYIWFNILDNLTYVVHNDSIWEQDIPKGRGWGTPGDEWTANYIYEQLENMSLENVEKLKIGYLEEYEDRNYSNKIELKDFSISFSHPTETYPFETPSPKTEVYPFPSGYVHEKDNGLMTYNYTFDNVNILNLVELCENREENWPFGGTYNNYHLNVSCEFLSNFEGVVGKAEYIESSDSIPEFQDGVVFIMNESADCEEKIENITHGIGCILLHNSSRGYCYQDAKNTSFSVNRVNESGNENLSAIIDMLKNGEIMLVDNMINNNVITFTYNLIEQNCIPTYDYMLLSKIRKPSEIGNAYDDLAVVKECAVFLWVINNYGLDLGHCHGFILYDYEGSNSHFWSFSIRDWAWFGVDPDNPFSKLSNSWMASPALPIFSVNYSVGNWLHENITTLNKPKASGYLDQEYKEQTPEDPGVESFNVVGYKNITQNPGDKIVVISNRFDGPYAEGAGDCGLGAGIVLGVAKYMNDYNIIPKFNLTFLMTTGEEYGMRGAQYFVDSHPEYCDKCILWIGADQLGFNQVGTNLSVVWTNETKRDIVWAIANLSEYTEKVNNNYGFVPEEEGIGVGGTETYVWRHVCDSICLVKDNTHIWDLYQRAGMNYFEGDAINYMDRDDANATLDLFWNITKYFCVDPDCWLTNVTFETFDSPDDGDALNDSINASFTLNTILPYENLRVELLYDVEGESNNNLYSYQNYTVNSSGLNASIAFSIPDNMDKGNYSLKLLLYNSTGIINKIVYTNGDYYNSSYASDVTILYHPFGYPVIGKNFETIDDKITGSNFTVNENCYANNITAYLNLAFMSPGPYQCMIYRANDSKLIGNTTENWTRRDYDFPPSSAGWAVFNFSEPKPLLTKDTNYVITCWGEDGYSRLNYDDFSNNRGRYDNETYGGPPDPANFSDENRLYSIYCSYTPFGPDISSVSASPDVVGFGSNITISANVTDFVSGVGVVKVNISQPDNSYGNFTMSYTGGDTFQYVFNDTWLHGQYNFSIWACTNSDGWNNSSSYSFNVSVNATITVCTDKDVYDDEGYVNVTDPPSNHQVIGYELLDDGLVLRVWNKFDSYYFNTSNGLQFTNHYDNYWSHNVLMLGYYNNDQWNLIYRIDELGGFNKSIISDNESFVNVTLWKDLSYAGYDFRLAIRYFLGVYDNELTVIPYIKNLGVEITYVLGFAWELKDIQVDMTLGGDYIEINGTSFYLNHSLDETYKNMVDPRFYIREDFIGNKSESLYLRWDENLNYMVKVKSRNGQYNAPVTLGIKIGTLDVGQEKFTSLFWHDACEMVYYFNSHPSGEGELWETNPGYMVDGNESTFASTSVDGDVELLDGNTCGEEDLGVICKVELRCRGYYSGSGGMGSDKNITLRPIFSGGDGDDHVFVTSSSAGWSVWFNITGDTNAPEEWNWKDVFDLCCDVESDLGSGFTLFCSKVEIRVTFNPYLGPEISNPYPANGSMGVPITSLLSITVSHPLGSAMNISWYSNCSGNWVLFGVNSSVYNGTFYQVFGNATVNGFWWYWKVNVSDDDIYNESSVFMFYTGNQSKIVNIGSTNFSGYLLMQVHFNDYGVWIAVDDVVDEDFARTVSVGGVFALDSVFNGKVETARLLGLCGPGLYRVYAAFRDPDGDVLVCDDDSLLEATYEFTVTFE